MPKLEAIVDMPFGVGIRKQGEQFEATDDEATILIALQRAKLVPATPAEPTPPVPDSAAAADLPASSDEPADASIDADAKPTPSKAAQKRTYNRRDMKAKG